VYLVLTLFVVYFVSALCSAGDFILRVFATKPIVLESVNPIPQYVLPGEWRRVGDLDSTGGALKIQHSDGVFRENPKWCQNPQYHVEVADPFGKEELYLKIVLKRTDHRASHKGHRGNAAHDHSHALHDQKKLDAHIGMVICKADQLEDNGPKQKKKPPKQNVMGEVRNPCLFCPLFFQSYAGPIYNSPPCQQLASGCVYCT
jgi:hypothetical protein